MRAKMALPPLLLVLLLVRWLSPSVPVPGLGGQTGFVLIVDEFTRHWFVYCIRQKSEVPGILRDFRAMAEKHYSSEVVIAVGWRECECG